MSRKQLPWKLWVIIALDLIAVVQSVRFYVKNTVFYLNQNAYIAGTERLPFQTRLLPVFFLRPLLHSRHFMEWAQHSHGLFPAYVIPFYLLSLLSLLGAVVLTQCLYFRLTRSRALAALVVPGLLYVVTWTYSLRLEANYSYPYDMLSLALFTAGVLCIYERKYALLLLVVSLETLTRETSLFLVVLYAIDAISRNNGGENGFLSRFDLRGLKVPRLLLLFCIYAAIRLALSHAFAHNDRSEAYIRIHENIGRLKLRLVPAMLNLCGYVLPIVCLYWRRIAPQRFGNYLLIVFLWIPVMFAYGVILETRIYGELCSLTTVAAVLILENFMASPQAHKTATFHTSDDQASTDKVASCPMTMQA